MKTFLVALFFIAVVFNSFKFSHQQTTTTPGFQFLGKGYDIYLGNIYDTSGNGDQGWREEVFQFTTNQSLKTPDNLWIVPDDTDSTLLSDCSVDQTETVLNDGVDYQNSVNEGFGANLALFGAAFQFSEDSKHVQKTTTSEQSIYAQLESTCAVYQLSLNIYKSPNVSNEFLAGVQSLTDTYDEDTYMTFVQTFGTHYVHGLTLGGRWGWLIEFDRKDFQEMLDDGVNFNAGLQYAGKIKNQTVNAGGNGNDSVDTSTVTKVTNSISHNFSYNIGGDYKPDAASWISSVRNNPMPIKLDTSPIWNLLTSSYLPTATNLVAKKALLMNATLNYCLWLQNNLDSSISCTRPQPIPKLQPTPVDPNAVRSICIHNKGFYLLSWRLYNNNKANHYAESSVFPIGVTKCLDGSQVQAEKGENLSCGLMIIWGKKNYLGCNPGNTYDPRSTVSANYVCWGISLYPQCSFEGYSQI